MQKTVILESPMNKGLSLNIRITIRSFHKDKVDKNFHGTPTSLPSIIRRPHSTIRGLPSTTTGLQITTRSLHNNTSRGPLSIARGPHITARATHSKCTTRDLLVHRGTVNNPSTTRGLQIRTTISKVLHTPMSDATTVEKPATQNMCVSMENR